MAEELLVKCRRCGLVYDKLRNRACPKCEPRIRPGSVQPVEASAAADSRGGGGSGDSASAHPKVSIGVPRAPVPRSALALLAGVAIGFAGARLLDRPAVREPVLLPLPTTSATSVSGAAPDAGGPLAASAPGAGAANPSGPPRPIEPAVVTGADGKAPSHPIELLDARRVGPRPDGTIEYTAVLVNRTPNTIRDIRVRGLGEDKKGHRVVTEEVAVEPGLVGAGREATARILVPEGTMLSEYSVTAWVQHGAMVRPEAAAEESAAVTGAARGGRGDKLRPFPPSTVPEPADLEPQPDAEAAAADEGAG